MSIENVSMPISQNKEDKDLDVTTLYGKVWEFKEQNTYYGELSANHQHELALMAVKIIMLDDEDLMAHVIEADKNITENFHIRALQNAEGTIFEAYEEVKQKLQKQNKPNDIIQKESMRVLRNVYASREAHRYMSRNMDVYDHAGSEPGRINLLFQAQDFVWKAVDKFTNEKTTKLRT